MARTAVLLSGVMFAALSLFSYKLFGWKLDGWLLLVAGAVHLVIVLRASQQLDTFVVVFHYCLALIGLCGVLWILVDTVGFPAGVGNIFLAILGNEWSSPSYYMQFAVYVSLRIGLLCFLIAAVSWSIHRRMPPCRFLLVGLFVGSLLNIPCDFALTDVLAEVVVLDVEKSRPFTFAVGLQSLDFPLLLHAIIAIGTGVAAWLAESRRRSKS